MGLLDSLERVLTAAVPAGLQIYQARQNERSLEVQRDIARLQAETGRRVPARAPAGYRNGYAGYPRPPLQLGGTGAPLPASQLPASQSRVSRRSTSGRHPLRGRDAPRGLTAHVALQADHGRRTRAGLRRDQSHVGVDDVVQAGRATDSLEWRPCHRQASEADREQGSPLVALAAPVAPRRSGGPRARRQGASTPTSTPTGR